MTAEERIAYFQGEKKRTSVSAKNTETNEIFLILKIKFFICTILFVLFLSLDFTEAEIKGITSNDIVNVVTSDFQDNVQFWRKLLN